VIALLAIIFCCKHCGCCGKNNWKENIF
jgi:hypothetical protein